MSNTEIANETQLSEKQLKKHEAGIKLCLATLRVAFPSQARNYSEEEYNLLFDLWRHIFVGIDLQILQKAVVRFIVHDRRGFYPSPGQVMEHIEVIKAELTDKQNRIDYAQSVKQLRVYNERIINGENCGTCVYVEYCEGRLFCNNPESCYYRGDDEYKIGTTAEKLCDLYEHSRELHFLQTPIELATVANGDVHNDKTGRQGKLSRPVGRDNMPCRSDGNAAQTA